MCNYYNMYENVCKGLLEIFCKFFKNKGWQMKAVGKRLTENENIL